MEIEIISERENKLLHRKEYVALVSHLAESTPTRIETRDKLAAHVNADANRTCVIKIHSQFGISQSKVDFRVYETAEQMHKIELPYILKRNGFIEQEEKN